MDEFPQPTFAQIAEFGDEQLAAFIAAATEALEHARRIQARRSTSGGKGDGP